MAVPVQGVTQSTTEYSGPTMSLRRPTCAKRASKDSNVRLVVRVSLAMVRRFIFNISPYFARAVWAVHDRALHRLIRAPVNTDLSIQEKLSGRKVLRTKVASASSRDDAWEDGAEHRRLLTKRKHRRFLNKCFYNR